MRVGGHDRAQLPDGFGIQRSVIDAVLVFGTPVLVNEQVEHLHHGFGMLDILADDCPAQCTDVGLRLDDFSFSADDGEGLPLGVFVQVDAALQRIDGVPLRAVEQAAFAVRSGFSYLAAVLYAEFLVNQAFVVQLVQGLQRFLGTGQGGAVHQLAVLVFNPDAGIGFKAVEEAAEAEHLAPQVLGDADDGVLLAVAVKVGFGESLGSGNNLFHGGGNRQPQLLQPVSPDPQQVGNHQGAVHVGQSVEVTVDGCGLEGRQSVGFKNLPGEIRGILFVDVFQGHDGVRFHQLAQLQRVDIHELRNVAHGDCGVQLGIVLVTALDDPVILDNDVQLITVQVTPEIVFHGLVRELGEEVRVQRVVRVAYEMDFHGLRILLGSGFGEAAGCEHAQSQHQRQNGSQFLHEEYLLVFLSPVSSGCSICSLFSRNQTFSQWKIYTFS